MRKLLLLPTLLLIAPNLDAGPRDWLKHHRRFVIAGATLVAASIVQYKGTSYCQRGDVERCVEGYGSRRAFNWFMAGTGAAMLGTAESCWKHDGPKPACSVLAYGVPATQVSIGIHDFRNYKPESSAPRQ